MDGGYPKRITQTSRRATTSPLPTDWIIISIEFTIKVDLADNLFSQILYDHFGILLRQWSKIAVSYTLKTCPLHCVKRYSAYTWYW
jgi:hypothetical protein